MKKSLNFFAIGFASACTLASFNLGLNFGDTISEDPVANAIAEANLAENMVQTMLMTAELAESHKRNQIAERANSINEIANHLANTSNQLVDEGNHLSAKANQLLKEANEIARESNDIARMNFVTANRANYLTEQQIEQDFKIAMMTLEQTRRLADTSSELDIMLNDKLTDAISTGFTDVAFAIKDGLNYIGNMIARAEYRFEINQTKLIATSLLNIYSGNFSWNDHLSRAEIMQDFLEKVLDEMEKLINRQDFKLTDFLHIAHLNTEEMQDKDCQWSEVRSRGFAINTMFLVLSQTIKRKNISSEFVPEIFEYENIRFFKSFVNFNIRSSYEFEPECFREKVCFKGHFSKMPSDFHCYNDEPLIAEYCDFSYSCEDDQATIIEEQEKKANRHFQICLKIFESRDCKRFKANLSEFIDGLPTCAFKMEPVLSEWGEFDACSKSCGSGWKVRERECIKGICNDDLVDFQSCQNKPCK